ncbi:DUF6932 family protein [Methylocystis hirsuta]|uniref:Uncharacterized protein n=1 Tax=Methylocystis hirsuta TaxID=369798 RepID=A0A3M9XMU7_9HYPH|nr:hypothetical protein [Methylocystis hirsuta]RNJ49052.1 hypothetical protein D1O30_04965 [Methylocystis hirsuta]
MIPTFNEKGNLPPGLHKATWEEFTERYGVTTHRKRLIELMQKLIVHLKEVQCQNLFVDGSFVTNKEVPNDYDACWDVTGVKIERMDPVLLVFTTEGKEKMVIKYGGDLRPDKFSPFETNVSYLEFFQIDREGDRKGIIHLSLQEIEL